MEILEQNLYIVIPALIIVLIAFFMSKSAAREGNASYAQKNTPGAQDTYEKAKNGDEKKLTMKERLELSWQFLYEITDIVLSKFSPKDQEDTLKIGRQLLENGGRYEHVIDYGIKHNLGRAEPGQGAAKGV
jgi:hypothetical protein